MEEIQTPRRRRKFSDEFKRDAVEIVGSSDRSIAEVAGELGIYDSSLGSWVRQDRIDRGERERLTSDEQQELLELRRETPGCGWSVNCFERAVAFWVRESNE